MTATTSDSPSHDEDWTSGYRRMETYLGAKMNVGSYDGDFGDSDHVHDADDAEEAEDVIVAASVLPQTPEHEE